MSRQRTGSSSCDRARGLRGNGASEQRHTTTCTQTDGRTDSHLHMHAQILSSTRFHRSIARRGLLFDRPPSCWACCLWPPCQLPTRTADMIQLVQTSVYTYAHAASGRFSRPAYGVHARAYIPRRLILSPAAAATGAVRLASVSAVLVLHLGIGQLLFLNLFRFRLLLRRSPLLFRFVLNPFVSLSVPAGGVLLLCSFPTNLDPALGYTSTRFQPLEFCSP
ncbi:hypothetical protein V8C44DRAFT_60517 [Trichoderma aethiopicum]